MYPLPVTARFRLGFSGSLELMTTLPLYVVAAEGVKLRLKLLVPFASTENDRTFRLSRTGASGFSLETLVTTYPAGVVMLPLRV